MQYLNRIYRGIFKKIEHMSVLSPHLNAQRRYSASQPRYIYEKLNFNVILISG